MWLILSGLMIGTRQVPPSLPPQRPVEVQEFGAKAGDVVSFHFLVKDAAGRVIADSEARGLSMTMRLGDPGNDPLLEHVAYDVVKTEVKTEIVSIEEIYPDPASRIMVPKKGLVTVRLTVLGVVPAKKAQAR